MTSNNVIRLPMPPSQKSSAGWSHTWNNEQAYEYIGKVANEQLSLPLTDEVKAEIGVAYEHFISTYPLKGGTEKELKNAFLIPLKELTLAELMFRVQKHIEMHEQLEKTGFTYLAAMPGPVEFLTEGHWKISMLLNFIKSNSQQPQEAQLQKIQPQVVHSMPAGPSKESIPKWEQVAGSLRTKIGKDSFESWFRRAASNKDFSLKKIEDGIAYLEVYNGFHAREIGIRFSNPLLESIQSVYPEVKSFKLSWREQLNV